MLYEYAVPVSHESWLTDEERRNMSERNRGAAASRQHAALPAADTIVAPPDPVSVPNRKKKTKHQTQKLSAAESAARQKERERAEMLERIRQTERNRMHARRFGAEYWQQEQPVMHEDVCEETAPEMSDEVLAEETKVDSRAQMLERMERSRHNRMCAEQKHAAVFAGDAAVLAEKNNADEIVEQIAEAVAAEKKPDERALMLERMQRSERNRMRAQYGDSLAQENAEEDTAASEPDGAYMHAGEDNAAAHYDYQDEYDTGRRTHAGWVAKRFLQRDSAFRNGFYFSFGSMVSGSSALRPEEETVQTPEQPEIGSLDEQDLLLRADAAPVLDRASGASSSGSARRKISGGRYSEYGKGNSYQRRITTGGSVVIGLLTVLLIGCVIYGKVQTNEIYTTIAELQAEYDDITAQNISMRSEMEGKMTVKNIEDYAENVLGLRQLDQSQIEYVQIQTEDEVVITEPDENLIVTINDYLNSFWEFLRGA